MEQQRRPGRRSSSQRGATSSDESSVEVKQSGSLWVCCDRCGKWRSLPGEVDSKRFEKRKWYCSMNPDPQRNSCAAPEEDYTAPRSNPKDRGMREFVRRWVARLRAIDQAEARLAKAPAGGRQTKKRPASEDSTEWWIRCCNPNCGKFRAVSNAVDARVLESRGEWYCVMNTWDEAVASCAAPQEIPEKNAKFPELGL